MQISRWKYPVIAVIAASFLGALFSYDLNKGIDLSGGSELIYELRMPHGEEVTPKLTRSTVDILQKRIDTFGMQEISIRPAGTRQIMIQIPGVSASTVTQIKKVIETAGKLAFKIVEKRTISAQAGDEDVQDQIRSIEELKLRGAYREADHDFDTAMYVVKDEDGNETNRFPILVMNHDTVPGELLESASKQLGFSSLEPGVDFQMKKTGASRLAQTTKKHQGSQMAIVLDGVVISAPNIRSPITGGRGEITGGFSQEEIKELVTVLATGALPAKPFRQSEHTIAPTLGEDSIQRGMLAIKIGIAATLVFMLIFYRLAGLIADVALVMNLVILFGVMVTLQATLTLPGLAGIVLTMGMAVDANILINERIREEFGKGVPIAEAVKAGYKHAFSAIIDSNLTTMLTAGILYSVGTGPIKGFAITLGVGILSSLFTALWVTRALFEFVVVKGWYTKPNYIALLSNTNIGFLKNRRPFVIGALVLANVGFLVFSARGTEKYGLDFNGGSAVQLQLQPDKAMTTDEVRAHLASIEEVGESGTVHPYTDVHISRLGELDADGRATRFQLLRTASGGAEPAGAQTEDAELPQPLSPEAGDEEGGAASEVAGEPGAGGLEIDLSELEAAEAAARPSERPQTREEVFIVAIEDAFEDQLVPSDFSQPVWETIEEEVAGQDEKRSMRRMQIQVRFDVMAVEAWKTQHAAEALPDGTGEEAFLAAMQDALEQGSSLAQGATVTADADSGFKGIVSYTVTTANHAYGTSLEKVENQVKAAVSSQFPNELSNPFPFKNSIGASVAQSLKSKGIAAILLSLLAMICYLAFRFEFKMGVAAALCLFHDVMVTLGVMMVLDMAGIDAKINLTTIAAFLTIVGYSINDTIVTFDRMRENLAGKRIESGTAEHEEILNRSINQMLSRTLLTSFTVLVVLVILALAGVSSLQGFTLALICGATIGTLSSIFVATPVLLADAKRLKTLIVVELAFVIVVGLFLPPFLA